MNGEPYIIVDASVAGAWSFNEQKSSEARLVLASVLANRVIALAPERFLEEFLRVCQKKHIESGGTISANEAWDRFLDIATLPIYLIPGAEIHEATWRHAIAVGLTTHDALYLAAADRWSAELWTLDIKLATRAKALGFNVFDLNSDPFPH